MVASAQPDSDVCAYFRELGIDRGRIDLEWRDWRWVAQLDEDRICFLADAGEPADRLAREAALLAALEGRLTCALPSVVAVSFDGRFQVRRMVHGDTIVGREPEIGRSPGWELLAESYGRAIASLHGAIDPAEAVTLVRPAPDTLPYAADRLRPLVDRFICDKRLARTIVVLLDAYESIVVQAADLVLLHGDLIVGNMTFDLGSSRLTGLFDFADADIGDRHRDLNYIHSFGAPFATRFMDAYEGWSQIKLDRGRPAIYHVASAISHLVGEDDPRAPSQAARIEQWVREIVAISF